MTRRLTLVARRDQLVDDVDEVKVGDTRDGLELPAAPGRLLSVAELQHALHLARATSPLMAAAASVSGRPPRPILVDQMLATPSPEPPDHPVADLAQPSTRRRPAWLDPHQVTVRAAVNPPTQRDVLRPRPPTTWLAVVGAHGGAGASTVAVALADAAATEGHPVHLISHAAPGSPGLGAATSEELGITDDRYWRRGRRGRLIIVDRCAGSEQASPNWPPFQDSGSGQASLTIVDVERASGRPVVALLSAAVVLVVFRVTVPGVQHAESVLAELGESGGAAPGNCHVLLAAVGPGRWPGVVTSAVGPLLGQHQQSGQLVSVPLDRRLERTGLTSTPLPKAVGGAGRDLWRLLASHPSRPVAVGHMSHPLTARHAVKPAVPADPAGGDLTEKDNPG